MQRFELDPCGNDGRKLGAAVAHLPAREIQKVFEDAVTRMLADGRFELTQADIRLDDAGQPVTWLH